MHSYFEHYKITATPMNSNKFTEFDMKNKKSDLQIKKPKKLNFSDFLLLKTLEN